MRRWLFLMGGLLVWALHFAGVYLIASVFDLGPGASSPASRWWVAGFTVVCALAAGALLALAARRPGFLRRDSDAEFADFVRWVGGLGAFVSLVAVIWQGLPSIIGH